MKKILSNIMVTTGISLVIMAVLAILYGAKVMLVEGIFQALLVNILIHIGYRLLDKRELKYPILENLISLFYTIVVVISCGELFGWFCNMSEWSMVIATILIYACGVTIGAINVLGEVKSINILLEKQNRKKN